MAPRQKYPSETADKFLMRLPDGLRMRIKAAARRNSRSMNSEIVATLAAAYPALSEPEAINDELLGAALAALSAANELGLSSAYFPRDQIAAAISKATTP